jgi:hypothetical protein
MRNISIKKSAALAVVRRKFLFLLCVVAGWLLLCHPAPASAAVLDGTIVLSGGKVAAGLGYTWGRGTLIFKGKRYPLSVSGIGLGSVGVNEYTGSGTVTGLRRPEDINGIFTSVGTGLTLGGGASFREMKNENGATIQLGSTTEGLSVSVAAGGMKVSIGE